MEKETLPPHLRAFLPKSESWDPLEKEADAPEPPGHDVAAAISELKKGGRHAIIAYLQEHVEEFRYLEEMRAKGWESVKGDAHFKKQRKVADSLAEKDESWFYNMTYKIGRDMHKATRAFSLSNIVEPAVLDMCMAPGAFVAGALEEYPDTRVRAMSLSPKDGGHRVRLEHEKVHVEFRDITMLAADMGMQKEDVPTSGPDPRNLQFDKVFSGAERFDLVLCDGTVLRQHKRTDWREPREASRLTLTELALGLEHLNNDGTMVILLHKLDSWACFHLIHKFSKFSTVQLFKHPRYHRMRSSFYLVAKKIQADSVLAKELVREWKENWKICTVGTDEEYSKLLQVSNQDAQAALDEFGERFMEMGRRIWKLQADSLAKAASMKSESKGQVKGNESEDKIQ